MNDQKPQSSLQGRCEFLDEDTLITGGKSVSEIIQMLRTNAKFKKIVKGCDDNEDKKKHNRKICFPWMVQFSNSCKEVISNPSIVKLDTLMSNFLKNVEKDVKQCFKKPKRAYRLRIRINPFLILFHMIYWDIKKPLEHTSYLDKMSDIMALYIDVELKSSRIFRETPKKISQRICTYLYVLLDKSTDHILDSVLKATFFNKKYREICEPVIQRLLKENPGRMYEANYVRFVLAFKLWKKLADKDQCANIIKDAIAKLKPPPCFAEKLKSGLFANVLPFPYVSKKESLTHFFIRSPFNVKEKAQLFLKDWRKLQPSGDFDKAFVFDEDFKMANVFDKESQRDENDDLINDIWNSLVEKEMDPVIELIDSDSMDEADDIVIDIKKNKSKEKFKNTSVKNSSCSFSKMSPVKKRKLNKSNLCSPVQNVPNKESLGIIKTENKLLVVPVSSKEDNNLISSITDKNLKMEENNNLSINNNVEVQKKPCATVEPKQSKEVEPDSQSITDGVLSSTHITIPPVTDIGLAANRDNVVTPTMNETMIEKSLPDIVDSTSICNEINIDTNINTQAIFDVDQIFKDNGYEQPLLEVAEEVIVNTEISQDEGSATLLIMDGDQVNLNHQDIMNVIGVPKNAMPFCSDSEANDSEYWKKNQDLTDGSELKNQCNSLNSHSKLNFVKDHSLTSTNNDNQLSLYENGSSCLVDQGQDRYVYNEMKLTRLLSAEINGDEGSDDDNRCTNNVFATGGKFAAFREQTTDESKSEGGEESEVLSPASQTDSTNLETSPESITSQPRKNSPVNLNCQDSVQETKPDLKTNKLPVTPRNHIPIDPSQLPEVSVSLAYMTDLGSLNDYHINKDKNSSKGMCEPPDSILHFKTVADDIKFSFLQQQLYTLYNTTENILDSDPVPYPPDASPINGHVRCPCFFCKKQLMYLVRNYKTLFDMRSFLICQEVDKTRMLSKFFHKIEQTKIEDEKLLKSIEETMPAGDPQCYPNANPKDVEPKHITECNSSINLLENDKVKTQIDSSKEIRILDRPLEETHEDKSDYSSLPPKKRKAFSLNADYEFENKKKFNDEDLNNKNTCILQSRFDPLDVPLQNSNTGIGHSTNACSLKVGCVPMKNSTTAPEKSKTPCSLKIRCVPINANLKGSNTSTEQSRTSSMIKQSFYIVNDEVTENSPQLKYCSEKSEDTESTVDNDIPLEDKILNAKCRKHSKKSKEKRRQRRERRRLKKLMKKERKK